MPPSFAAVVEKRVKMILSILNDINSLCYAKVHKILIECDPAYYRPLEVDTLLGDASKAKKKLNWKPKTNLKSLVKEMVAEELSSLNAKKK